MADLRPVHARIERAHHHVADLERLLSNYSGRSFQRSMRAGSVPDRIVERAELVEDPPIEAAMVVSDAVHQARAALDNLVNALRPDGAASGVFFPIRATPESYAEAVSAGALRGVPEWARETIVALQPFSIDVRRWAGRELPNLHELARLDRHRLPPIHAALLAPDYASGDTQARIEARLDPARRWAEWEYDAGRGPVTVAFRVEVQFGPDSRQPDGVEVAGWTAYLIRGAAAAVDMVCESRPLRLEAVRRLAGDPPP